MEATANSDQLIDVVYLVGLVCLVSLAVVVLRIAWVALFKERKKPDRPVWHDLSVGMDGPANQTACLVPETRRPGEKIS